MPYNAADAALLRKIQGAGYQDQGTGSTFEALERRGLVLCKDEISRWSLEVTFEEGRAHVGIETQRRWSDVAIERSTPLLFGLYSLVTLFGRALHPNGHIPAAQTAWYRKQTATFRDVRWVPGCGQGHPGKAGADSTRAAGVD